MAHDESEDTPPESPVRQSVDEMLDQELLDSFPASDPESSWSGLSEPDPGDGADGERTDNAG